MSRSVRKGTVRKTLAIVAGLAAVLFFAFGGTLLDVVFRARDKVRLDLSRRLGERHGIVFLAGFDETVPADAITQLPLQCQSARGVKGVYGAARRLSLDAGSHLQSENRPLAKVGEAGTLSAWFRPADLSREQDFFSFSNVSGKFSLTLSEGKLTLSVTASGKTEEGRGNFVGRPGEFVHVAVAISGKEAVAYQGGRETFRVGLPEGFSLPPLPLMFGAEMQRPFEGDVDELALWKRSLTGREIHAIAHSKVSLKVQCEAFHCAFAAALDSASRFLSVTYRSIDRLFPPLHHNPAPIAKEIPALTFWPSKHDFRHFAAAHAEALAAGFRTRNASKARSVDVSFGGKTAKLEVFLDDTYVQGGQRRMAFVVSDPAHVLFGGSGVMRLYPPELHTVIHPDAPWPFPLSGKFVRLSSGEDFRGLYVLEPFEHTGSAWMARGRRDVGFTRALYYSGVPSPCDFPPPGMTEEEAFAGNSSLILSDVLFPWSRQEVFARKKALARKRRDLDFTAANRDDLFIRQIIGDNPSPQYITGDLPLRQFPQLRWKSSNPALISENGSVHRPECGAPVEVTLTPIAERSGERSPVSLRVIPVKASLPTLFIYVGTPVEKFRRTDFTCFRIPENGGSPEWLSGLGSTKGGIKHRGNTSYTKGVKRSFSLEFDEPHAFGASGIDARHLLLLSGYADPTRLRNKISFDAYRLANDGSAQGVTDISWTEVFVNNEYFGVWEICHRVKDVFVSATDIYKVRTRNVSLWATTATDMTEVVSKHDSHGGAYGPLESLFEFTSSSLPEDFVKLLDCRFSLDSLIDYYLMLNFTQNRDGLVTNQYIARDSDGRWSVIPWDYDKTFFDAAEEGLSNMLIDRLEKEYPDFSLLLAEKWHRLRSGPLSDAAVNARMSADAGLLAPYMVHEYALLQPAGWDGDFPSAVAKLKEIVFARLLMMDRKFNGKPFPKD